MKQLPDNPVKYSIRVYMLIVDNERRILVSDEYQMDMKMSKFPGGGMENGEGTIQCLQREAMEEFGQELKNIRHFYTTDYYQKAWFFNDHQLISVYYLADPEDTSRIPASDRPFDFDEYTNGEQSFRWVPLDELQEEDMTLPIDRKVAGMLKNTG